MSAIRAQGRRRCGCQRLGAGRRLAAMVGPAGAPGIFWKISTAAAVGFQQVLPAGDVPAAPLPGHRTKTAHHRLPATSCDPSEVTRTAMTATRGARHSGSPRATLAQRPAAAVTLLPAARSAAGGRADDGFPAAFSQRHASRCASSAAPQQHDAADWLDADEDGKASLTCSRVSWRGRH